MDNNAAQSRRALFLAVGEPLKPSKFAPRDARKDSLKQSPTSNHLSPSLSPNSIDASSPDSAFVSPLVRRLNGHGLERVNTLKAPIIRRPSALQVSDENNRRVSETFARRATRSRTQRMQSMKPKALAPEPEAAMHTPNLFKEYKYRKSSQDTVIKVGSNNEEREIKRLSVFSAFGSRVIDTRPTSPSASQKRFRSAVRKLSKKSKESQGRMSLLAPMGMGTPAMRHNHPGQNDSHIMTMHTGTSHSSDDEEYLTPEQKRLRKILKRAFYTTYFVGVMISFKNKVKMYGALRPIQYLEEFESLQPKERPESILPILPTTLFSLIWAITIFFCLSLTAVLTPIYISFAEEDNSFFYYMNLITDIFFGFDIVINFLSAYYDSNRDLVTDFKKIAIKYLRSWFWIDFLAVVPIDKILQEQADLQSSHKIFRLLRFPRLYKLFKILRLLKVTRLLSSNRSFSKLNKKLSLNKRLTKILKIFINFAFLNHLVGCLWFFVARYEDFNPDTWVGRTNLVDKDSLTQYIASIYWSFQTLTTVGYGDLAPQTSLERSLSSIWIVIGVLVYTFTLGNLSALLFGFQMKAESLREKLVSFERFAITANVPDFLAQKVRRFYEINHKENAVHWIDPDDNLKSLPANLRTSMLLYSYYNFIKEIKVLQINANLTAALLVHFKLLKLKIGEIIYRQDDPCNEIYFIAQGTVKFVTQKAKGIFSLSQGTYFGELEAFEGTKRACFCRALDSTVLLLCPKNDFLKILQDFPDIESQMKRIAVSRRGKLEEKVARIIKAEEMEKTESNSSSLKSASLKSATLKSATLKSPGMKSPTLKSPTLKNKAVTLVKTTEYINKILLGIPDPEVRYQKRRRERQLIRPKSIIYVDPASLSHLPSPDKRSPKKKKKTQMTPRGNFMISMEDVDSLGDTGSIVLSTNALPIPLPKQGRRSSNNRKSRFEVTPVTLSKINEISDPSLPSIATKKDFVGESEDNLISLETKNKDIGTLTKVDKFETLMDQFDVGTTSFSTISKQKDFQTRWETEEKTPTKIHPKFKRPPPIQTTSVIPTKKNPSFGSNLLSIVTGQGLKGLLKPAPKIAPAPERTEGSTTDKTYQRFLLNAESDFER